MTDAARFLPGLLDFMAAAGEKALSIQAAVSQTLKQDKSIVTEADLAISAMFAAFVEALPTGHTHYIIDEETCGNATEGLAAAGRADYVWVIDPIDGTAPYAHGLPTWGTMVALYSGDGRPLIAAITLPALGETVYSNGTCALRLDHKTGMVAPVPPAAPRELHRQSIVLGPNWMGEFDYGPLLFMDTHAAATYAAFTVLGRSHAAFFGPPMKLWDAAITLPLAHCVGLALVNTRTGSAAKGLADIAVADDWRPKDIYVLCHPAQSNIMCPLWRGTPVVVPEGQPR